MVPGDTVFYTNDTGTLECVAIGFPTPAISYYFNGVNITSEASNGVLTLKNVTAANAGPYQCFADNVRADSSELWIVTVRDPCEYKAYLYYSYIKYTTHLKLDTLACVS